MKLKIFVVYHKIYYAKLYSKVSEDYFNNTINFFGVNEIYYKKESKNVILEHNLPIYNPFLQKRGYMETSAYLHIFWNKLYLNNDFIGICQYDMDHNKEYTDLNSNTIYILNSYKKIVLNNKWNNMMFPQLRNLDYLIKSYNTFFKKSYNIQTLNNLPLSLWQTNIYPSRIFYKLCKWLEVLVEEIYPWCNQPPYEIHWGSIGGYTERAISIFNAFEIYEGCNFENLCFSHLNLMIKEQYNSNSFLNNYDYNIYSKLILSNNLTNLQEVCMEVNEGISIIRDNINGITNLYLINKDGEHIHKSKPIMLIVNQNSNFKKLHNILHDKLDEYTFYYKIINPSEYELYLKKSDNVYLSWNIVVDNKQFLPRLKFSRNLLESIHTIQITHFLTKCTLKIPLKNKYTNELKQRWSNHEPQTNKKVLTLLKNIEHSKEKQYIFDAGCHVGDTLLMISKYLVDNKIDNINLLGIDPDKDKINFIKDILEINNLKNVELFNCALSEEKFINKNCIINRQNENSGAWTTEIINNSNYDCKFNTIDNICKNKKINIIHLDVEGYEIFSLTGGIETIKNNKPSVIIEYEHLGINNLQNWFSRINYTMVEKISQGDCLFLPILEDYSKFTMVNLKHINQLQ